MEYISTDFTFEFDRFDCLSFDFDRLDLLFFEFDLSPVFLPFPLFFEEELLPLDDFPFDLFFNLDDCLFDSFPFDLLFDEFLLGTIADFLFLLFESLLLELRDFD